MRGNLKISLKGKVCLIIGGTRGIGFAVAKNLHNLGATVVICGRNKKRAENAARKISSEFSNTLNFKCDITKPNDIKKMMKVIIKKCSKVDILISAASIFKPFGNFERVPFSEHEKTIKTNLLGTMNCCHEVIKLMKKQKSGTIILFSGGGIGNDAPLDNASSYYVSKGALVFLAEVLAVELLSFNISINAIVPGRILTDSTSSILKMPEEKIGKVLFQSVKEFKKGGQPIEQVTDLVSFLCSVKSNHLTGKMLSARWDDTSGLSGNLPHWQYTLKRIDGEIYTRNT